MPTAKKQEDSNNKNAVYKEAVPNAGTPYKVPENVDSDMLKLRTTVVARDGYRTYWARESDARFHLLDGYDFVDPADYPLLGGLRFQDSSSKGSTIRLPTRDSDEDLILMEIPLDKYAANKAQELARVDAIEKQLERGLGSEKLENHVTSTDTRDFKVTQ